MDHLDPPPLVNVSLGEDIWIVDLAELVAAVVRCQGESRLREGVASTYRWYREYAGCRTAAAPA